VRGEKEKWDAGHPGPEQQRTGAAERWLTLSVIAGLDPAIHEAEQRIKIYELSSWKLIMDCRVIGERSDAVL
jgi:hypothetical protein